MIVIFDWDGTLCDSIDHIVEAMQDAAREAGLTVPEPASVREIVGLGLPQAIAQLFPELDTDGTSKLAASYSKFYVASDQGPAPLYPGAMETLHNLHDLGLELAVATGKSRRGLNRVLAGLGLERFFHSTRCADETQSKPHPQMLNEIMAERDKASDEVVMVGDTEFDLAMATNAGVVSVGVSYGVHAVERLHNHAPVAVIDALPELLSLPVIQRQSA
ncbi:MAG: HAD-IA family hydrolase [Halieaceae bacterium]